MPDFVKNDIIGMIHLFAMTGVVTKNNSESGYSAFDYAFTFLSQPILTKLFNNISNQTVLSTKAYNEINSLRKDTIIRIAKMMINDGLVNPQVKSIVERPEAKLKYLKSNDLSILKSFILANDPTSTLNSDFKSNANFSIKDLENGLNLKGSNITVSDLINQLAILDKYEEYSNLSNQLTTMSVALGTDKTGAGPDSNSTYKVLNAIKSLTLGNTKSDEIKRYIDDKSMTDFKEIKDNFNNLNTEPVIMIDDEPAMFKVYPQLFGIDKPSVYGSLQSYLMLGNINSVNLLKSIFIQETPNIINYIDKVNKLSHKPLTTKQRSFIKNKIVLNLVRNLPLYNITTNEKRAILGIPNPDVKTDVSLKIKNADFFVLKIFPTTNVR
jgi:predicted transposase YbfD/YdcC/predicted peroxiredoxin